MVISHTGNTIDVTTSTLYIFILIIMWYCSSTMAVVYALFGAMIFKFIETMIKD